MAKKILKIVGLVAAGLFALYCVRPVFRDVHPIVFVIFAPVIATIIAKFISNNAEDEGKMSQAYKKRFPKNQLAFRAFCVLSGCILLWVVAEEKADIGSILPTAVCEVGKYVYLVLFVLTGVVWVVSEVVRRDFPWGLFRLMERLVYVVLICAGVFFVGQIVGPYLVYIGMILLPVIMIGAVVLLWKLLWEGWLWLMYRDPEERKKVVLELERMEARCAKRERINKEKWDNASPKDIWGNPYAARDQDGYVKKVRKTSDGTYVDKDGNEYREVE